VTLGDEGVLRVDDPFEQIAPGHEWGDVAALQPSS
jgi:hypothetical protein